MKEETIEVIESVGNTLRGMSFDPRIPADIKEVLLTQVYRLDKVAVEYHD